MYKKGLLKKSKNIFHIASSFFSLIFVVFFISKSHSFFYSFIVALCTYWIMFFIFNISYLIFKGQKNDNNDGPYI